MVPRGGRLSTLALATCECQVYPGPTPVSGAPSYHGRVPPALLLVPLAYLLGTFPTAVLVGRAAGHDPTAEGSGNPGASNVYRLAGARAGAVVFAGDLLKGVLPALAGLAVAGSPFATGLGTAAALGHMFPVTRGFRGGRGVATVAGLMCVLHPLVSVGQLVVWFAVARLSHRASVASLVIAVALPAALAAVGRPGWEVAAAGALCLLVIVRHAPNVRRLLTGEERRLDRGGVR